MKGLQLLDNFISEQDESNLIQQPWDTSISRRTQHYGFRYDYTNKDAANSAAPIPDWCNPIIDKMLADNLLKERRTNLVKELLLTLITELCRFRLDQML